MLYPCYETAEELDLRRKVRLSRKLPPVYGREALALTSAEMAAFEAEGRRAHWRFLLPNFTDGEPENTVRTEVTWNDLVRGEETVDLASLSDPVLVREDGTYLYTLPSVVDDIEMGITHVIRGDDHVTNTGVQIALFRALGAEPPAFGHHNLLTTSTGEGLSKRTGALSVGSLRDQGIEPMAVASLAVLTGTSENIAAQPTMEALAEHFDPASVSKSAAKFDPDDLFVLNRALLHEMPFSEARDRLAIFGVSGDRAEEFWLAVRGNIDRVQDAANWWRIVREGPAERPELSDDDRDYVRAALEHLPDEPWDKGTWKSWTEAVKAATGRKGKSLFMPLRLALTGLSAGPDLAIFCRTLIGQKFWLDNPDRVVFHGRFAGHRIGGQCLRFLGSRQRNFDDATGRCARLHGRLLDLLSAVCFWLSDLSENVRLIFAARRLASDHVEALFGVADAACGRLCAYLLVEECSGQLAVELARFGRLHLWQHHRRWFRRSRVPW